ncbi:MAG: N-methyl-L-tryptophan oxidase [Myxococcales bacterium]|jgi:sarcosine oxidase|nr:N-methyl-L-tryptophan oxidase [Myxococcales bacterium]
MSHFDVIVVGAGAIGAATTWKLALRGAKVLVLEREHVGHARGSSHGGSRIYRQAYFEHPDYVPLLREAYEDWSSMPGIFAPTGAVYLGPASSDLIAGSLRAAALHALRLEALSPGDPRRRLFPGAASFEALFEPTAGWVDPERAVRWMLDRAVSLGAHLREGVRVLSLRSQPDRVTLDTDAGELTASKVVVCGGPWTKKLLENLPVALRVTRQAACWFEVPAADRHRLAALPVFAIEDERGAFVYGFPIDSEGLLKVASHDKGEVIDPDDVSRASHATDEDAPRGALQRYFGVDGWRLARTSVCLYTNTPDGHYLLDRVPGERGVFFIGGTSGHGFKLAPVLGAAMAEIALDGGTSRPVGFLALSRFEGAT